MVWVVLILVILIFGAITSGNSSSSPNSSSPSDDSKLIEAQLAEIESLQRAERARVAHAAKMRALSETRETVVAVPERTAGAAIDSPRDVPERQALLADAASAAATVKVLDEAMQRAGEHAVGSRSLSTVAIAEKYHISPSGLFDYLMRHQYLEKKDGKNFLTQKGLDIGGSYRVTANDRWPLWSEENLGSIIQRIQGAVSVVGTVEALKLRASGRLQAKSANMGALHEALRRGTKELQTKDELDAYLHFYGAMHERKLMLSYDALHRQENLTRVARMKDLQIIDYACGQGLASMELITVLNKRYKDNLIDKLVLIEPSFPALKICTGNFTGNVVKINKKFDELTEHDLSTTDSCTKFHLFSNILDMADTFFDPAVLARKIIRSQKGTNYFVCVSAREQAKLAKFMQYFDAHILISSFSGQIPNPSPHQHAKPWQVVWNIFKVEL